MKGGLWSRADRSDFSTSARLFSAEVFSGWLHFKLQLKLPERDLLGIWELQSWPSEKNQINAYFLSRCKQPPSSCCDIEWQKAPTLVSLCCALVALSGPPALSLHTAAGFTLRLRQLTFRLIIVVCDISKRIMRMKCDKNYFHVTPEHLTYDGLVQRSTGAQTSGTVPQSLPGNCKKTII